jgi:hypothetical protein
MSGAKTELAQLVAQKGFGKFGPVPFRKDLEKFKSFLLNQSTHFWNDFGRDIGGPQGPILQADKIYDLVQTHVPGYISFCQQLAHQTLEQAFDEELSLDHQYAQSQFKPHGVGGPTDMHQDFAFWPNAHRVLTLWMPLAGVTEKNCMSMVVGSHKQGRQDQTWLAGQKKHSELAMESCFVEEFSLHAHEGHTWHCSSGNAGNDQDRLVLIVHNIYNKKS